MTKKRIITSQVKRDEQYTACVSRCKCGHRVVMKVQQDEIICSWCGKKMHNNSREYFKYKLKQAMK